ncbi:HAMP domain-containing histidine kinase [Sphingomonadaceae bacterium LXI357]|uniref:histidine kinase n=2 Tax=Stakelama marina TaxID=2826939 RepID=A0A8T4IAY7_9SPHN|nr:HAMP domain-containing histidine kinase [Stakelama marina]
MRQLIALRWLAVIGQYATIQVVHFTMGVHLPIAPMFAILAALVVLNVVSTVALHRGIRMGERELLLALLIDVAGLAGLLYFSGGATNPFVSLFLLQVVLGAVLLRPASAWVIVGVTTASFLILAVAHRPLVLPPRFMLGMFDLYIIGALISFVLIAALLVLFLARVNANLRARDARLATLRQQAVEEDHIVRMGLLASGAAHELGTPLASLSVIVNDWSRMPRLTEDSEIAEEIADMRVAVDRCKAIVSGILMSAGEARGEQTAITTVGRFFDEAASEWRKRNGDGTLVFTNHLTADPAIVSDAALKQVIWNVLDNAWEASHQPIELALTRDGDELVLTTRDHGPGFADAILSNWGKPYQSTKGREGGGLGLFLVVNVMRKMGGRVEARNDPSGGAVVTLALPLETIAWTGERQR